MALLRTAAFAGVCLMLLCNAAWADTADLTRKIEELQRIIEESQRSINELKKDVESQKSYINQQKAETETRKVEEERKATMSPTTFGTPNLNFTLNGEYRARFFAKNNMTDFSSKYDDATSYFDARFRTDITTTVNKKFSGIFSLDLLSSSNYWDRFRGINDVVGSGDNSGVTPDDDDAGNYTLGSTGSINSGHGGSFNLLSIHEAYFKLDFDPVTVFAGHRHETIGHGMLLNTVGDNAILAFRYDPYTVKAGLFIPREASAFTSYTENLLSPSDKTTGSDDDTYILYADVSYKINRDHEIGIFGLYVRDQESMYTDRRLQIATDPDFLVSPLGDTYLSLNVLNTGGPTSPHKAINQIGDSAYAIVGVTADGNVPIGSGKLYYAGEFDLIHGKFKADRGSYTDSDISGYNFLLETNYETLLMDRPAGIGVNFYLGSGQDQKDAKNIGRKGTSGGDININDIGEDFKIANILTDELNPNGIQNLTAVKLHASMRPISKLNADAAFIYAQYTEKPADGASSRNLGTEFDLNFEYAFDNYVSLAINTGFFMPGSGLREYNRIAGYRNPASAGLPRITGRSGDDDMGYEVGTTLKFHF